MAHEHDRRNFLRMLGAGSVAAAFPESIRRAMAIPANNATGTIKDVEHIVILMQENRSFDHYLGTLSGIRGFNDPRVANLASGQPVWYQPNGTGGYVLPFRPDEPNLGLVFIEDLAHDWDSTHAAWNNGLYDQWVPEKGTTTMAHLTRNDIPFHYALADAFTVCDAYHCSVLGATDPNRYHMFTGWVGNDGTGGGPVLDNAEAGYSWSTYPERLQAGGISWKVYQDVGSEGLTVAGEWGYAGNVYAGNYGDNSLLYFFQYQNASSGSPLAELARTGTNITVGGTLFDQFRADIAAGTLPQVSWIVAPEAYCEHPNWCANFGAYYISEMLDALTSNPEIWSKTALFITYDENDGFFDHAVPPTPPTSRANGISTVSTVNEVFPGSSEFATGPIGLGARVPMLVVSPWSRGGFVNSQVFDHTSLIRFIEARFAGGNPELIETNITPWRRAVSGDLTTAFDFKNPNRTAPPALPSTASYVPPNQESYPDYVPTVPAMQALPTQEAGLRPARPLPYAIEATGTVSSGTVSLLFANSGSAAAVFQVRANNGAFAPLTYTVGGGQSVTDRWALAAGSVLDASVLGPNGFLRQFGGTLGRDAAGVEVEAQAIASELELQYRLVNTGAAAVTLSITNGYTGTSVEQVLEPGQTVTRVFAATPTYGWYDVIVTTAADSTFLRRLAGHIENGRDSITDPAIGLPLPNHV